MPATAEALIFDSERYIREVSLAKQVKEIKAPNNKVPAQNLVKLAPEKKMVAIELDVSLGKDFTLRDRFDWDMSQNSLRPVDFATALVLQLPMVNEGPNEPKKQHYAPHLSHIYLTERRQEWVKKVTDLILEQITSHIEKNTFFPRQRLNKKEEDIISKQQVCVNCDSILSGP